MKFSLLVHCYFIQSCCLPLHTFNFKMISTTLSEKTGTTFPNKCVAGFDCQIQSAKLWTNHNAKFYYPNTTLVKCQIVLERHKIKLMTLYYKNWRYGWYNLVALDLVLGYRPRRIYPAIKHAQCFEMKDFFWGF